MNKRYEPYEDDDDEGEDSGEIDPNSGLSF